MIYLSEGNVPSRSANSLQVIHMSSAFSKLVDNFELVTIGDLFLLFGINKFSIEKWYGIKNKFKITKIPFLLRASYPFKKGLRYSRYYKFAPYYIILRNPDFVYTRSIKMVKKLLSLKIKVILEWHTYVPKNFFKDSLFKKSNFIGIVTISDLLANNFIQNGVLKKKILIIQDGVDLSLFKSKCDKKNARMNLGLDLNAKLVVYSGHLYSHKGIPLILNLAKEIKDVTFLLVGGWEEDIISIKNECKKRNLSNVIVAGYVNQSRIAQYLFSADVLILPNSNNHYQSESTSPLKLFEYMAVGRPIIASSLKNILNVLEDRRNSLLVKPDSVKAFKSAILEIFNNRNLAEYIAKNANKDSKKYSWIERAKQIFLFFKLVKKTTFKYEK